MEYGILAFISHLISHLALPFMGTTKSLPTTFYILQGLGAHSQMFVCSWMLFSVPLLKTWTANKVGT